MSVHWNAAMISPVEDLDGAPLLRTEVDLDPGHGDVTDARLHVSALGVFKGSSLGMLECKSGTIDVKLSGGVGYVIPKVVTNIINGILSGLNIKYRLVGEGGISSGAPLTLYTDTTTLRACNAGKE